MYSQTNKTFKAKVAIGRYLLVKLDTTEGQVDLCGAGEVPHGVSLRGEAAGMSIAVMPLGKPSATFKLTAAGAIALGARLVPAANGQVDDTGGGPEVAIALQPATAAGEEIECLPLPAVTPQRKPINTEAITANKTLTIADAEVQFLAPDAARDVTLPAEALSDGLVFEIHNTAGGAFSLTVKDDGAATIGTVAQNKAARFVCDGASWKTLAGA